MSVKGRLIWLLLILLTPKALSLRVLQKSQRAVEPLSPLLTTSSPPAAQASSTLGTTTSSTTSPLRTTTELPQILASTPLPGAHRFVDEEPLDLDEIASQLDLDQIRLERYRPRHELPRPLEHLRSVPPSREQPSNQRLLEELNSSRERLDAAYNWTATGLKQVLVTTVPSLLRHLAEIANLRDLHCSLRQQQLVLADRLLHREKHQRQLGDLRRKLDRVISALRIVVDDPKVQERLHHIRSRRSLPEDIKHLLQGVLSKANSPLTETDNDFRWDNSETNNR